MLSESYLHTQLSESTLFVLVIADADGNLVIFRNKQPIFNDNVASKMVEQIKELMKNTQAKKVSVRVVSGSNRIGGLADFQNGKAPLACMLEQLRKDIESLLKAENIACEVTVNFQLLASVTEVPTTQSYEVCGPTFANQNKMDLLKDEFWVTGENKPGPLLIAFCKDNGLEYNLIDKDQKQATGWSSGLKTYELLNENKLGKLQLKTINILWQIHRYLWEQKKLGKNINQLYVPFSDDEEPVLNYVKDCLITNPSQSQSEYLPKGVHLEFYHTDKDGNVSKYFGQPIVGTGSEQYPFILKKLQSLKSEVNPVSVQSLLLDGLTPGAKNNFERAKLEKIIEEKKDDFFLDKSEKQGKQEKEEKEEKKEKKSNRLSAFFKRTSKRSSSDLPPLEDMGTRERRASSGAALVGLFSSTTGDQLDAHSEYKIKYVYQNKPEALLPYFYDRPSKNNLINAKAVILALKNSSAEIITAISPLDKRKSFPIVKTYEGILDLLSKIQITLTKFDNFSKIASPKDKNERLEGRKTFQKNFKELHLKFLSILESLFKQCEASKLSPSPDLLKAYQSIPLSAGWNSKVALNGLSVKKYLETAEKNKENVWDKLVIQNVKIILSGFFSENGLYKELLKAQQQTSSPPVEEKIKSPFESTL